ncbi:MAG: MFS transporter [Alphaproteobacteria bacterium]
MKTNLKIRRNITLIPIFNFFTELRFFGIIELLFFAEITKSYTLAMSIFTIGLFAVSIFEVPTGILSDKMGRKLTIVASTIFDIFGFISYGLGGVYQSYWLLALGGVLQGVAQSFYSGTGEALLYETLVDLRKKNKYHEVYGKTSSIFQISLAVSALCGAGIAYLTSYLFVVWLSLIPQIICLFTALSFVEPKKRTNNQENVFKHLKEAFNLFLKNKKLRFISIASILSYSFGDASHSFQIVFFNTLVPTWVIGIARTLKQLGGALSFWFAGAIINKLGHGKVLIGGNILMEFFGLIAIACNSALSPFLFATNNLFYGATSTSKMQLMQNEFSDTQRATMGSLISFVGNIMFGIVSMMLGYVADLSSPRIALLITIAPAPILIWLYSKTLKS